MATPSARARRSSRPVQTPAPTGARVQAAVFHNVPEVLRRLGANPQAVLQRAGLTAADLTTADGTLTFAEADGLLTTCRQVTRCPHFGLLVGQDAGLNELGLAGRLARNAATVGDALRDLMVHFVLHDTGGTTSISVHGEAASLCYDVHTPGISNLDQIYDIAAAVGFNALKELCGPDWRPDAVLLPRARPSDIGPYRRLFGAPLKFNAARQAIVFGTAWLARPVAGADPLVRARLEDRARQSMDHLDPLLDGDVRRAIRVLLVSGECSREAVASRLGMHHRSLNRRLQAVGTTFRSLLDETRFEMAQQLLCDTRLAVAGVSRAVGFADPTVFTRAFRRWSGRTPRAFRTALSEPRASLSNE